MNLYIAYFFGIIGCLAASLKLYEFWTSKSPRTVFIFDDIIDLYKSSINVKGIEILHKGLPIKENLYVIRYFFAYLGSKDIVSNDFIKNIEVNIKGDGRLLSNNIVYNPYDINLDHNETSKGFLFKADLIKNEDFFVGEMLIENQNKIDNPREYFDLSSRIINIEQPTIYDYRNFTYYNSSIVADFLFLFSIPFGMLFLGFLTMFVQPTDDAKMKFFKNKQYINVDSMANEVNNNEVIYNFLKNMDIKNKTRDSLHNEHMLFTKAYNKTFGVKAWTKNGLKTIETDDTFLGYPKSDTFLLGDGYSMYYERESLLVYLMFPLISIVSFVYLIYLGYKINKERVFDWRIRLIYSKARNMYTALE